MLASLRLTGMFYIARLTDDSYGWQLVKMMAQPIMAIGGLGGVIVTVLTARNPLLALVIHTIFGLAITLAYHFGTRRVARHGLTAKEKKYFFPSQGWRPDWEDQSFHGLEYNEIMRWKLLNWWLPCLAGFYALLGLVCLAVWLV